MVRAYSKYLRQIGFPFSQQYVYNPYLTKLRDAGFYSGHAPAGFPSQLDLNTLYGKLTNSCL